MRKHHLLAALFIAVAVWVSACEIIPNFSNTPNIEFRSIRRIPISPALGDTLVLEFFFQDGDGDVGIFDGTDQRLDFFAIPFKRFNGRFDTLRFSGSAISFNGQMPRMVNGGRPGPIEGTVSYFARIFPPPLGNPDPRLDIQLRDTLRFNIFIRDRAGNRSNTITTEPIVVLAP